MRISFSITRKEALIAAAFCRKTGSFTSKKNLRQRLTRYFEDNGKGNLDAHETEVNSVQYDYAVKAVDKYLFK